MIIKSVQVFATNEVYKRPIPIAVGTHDSRRNVIVKITAENGLSGYGEGSPLIPSYSGENQSQMIDDIVLRIVPDIIGKKVNSIDDILSLLDDVYKNKYDFNCSISPIDIALFDLLGKQKKKPVFVLIRDYLNLPAFRQMPILPANFTVSRNATKTNDKVKEMVREADSYVKKGYSVIKIKIGIFKDSDYKAVKALYDHFNKNYDRKISLFVDGNQAYDSVDEVLKVIRKIGPFIDGLEQPFNRNKPYMSANLNKKLRKMKNPPFLITDEGSSSFEQIENIVHTDAAMGSLLKMVRSGGFNFIIKLVRFLKKYPNFKLEPMSMTETGIGTAANLHSALVVYKFCNLESGFGFDGPMQVIGDSYKDGNDTILYEDKLSGWIINNNGGIAIYDPNQIIGNKLGLGQKINETYLRKISQYTIQIDYKHSNYIVKRDGKILLNKPLKEIISHPRY